MLINPKKRRDSRLSILPEERVVLNFNRKLSKGHRIDGSLKLSDFSIEVSENLTGPGGALHKPTELEKFGVKRTYRVVVIHTESAIPQWVGFAASYLKAHRKGRKYVKTLCAGKKKLIA